MKNYYDGHPALCLACTSCYIINSSGAYSDVTPGDDFEIICEQNRFKFHARSDGRDSLFELMKTAFGCEEFNPVEPGRWDAS
jgi:hypothetical protein